MASRFFDGYAVGSVASCSDRDHDLARLIALTDASEQRLTCGSLLAEPLASAALAKVSRDTIAVRLHVS